MTCSLRIDPQLQRARILPPAALPQECDRRHVARVRFGASLVAEEIRP
jgi:hypothetical protein